MLNRVLSWKSLLIFIFSTSLISSCGRRFARPPAASAACDLILSNIFSNCFNPLQSTSIISYNVNVYVKYYDAGTRDYEMYKTITASSPNPANSNITVPIEIPKAGAAYMIDVYIDATECSTCALPEMGPNDPCTQHDSGPYVTAARPRLFSGEGVRSDNPPSISISRWEKYHNVSGSCGCEVPKN